MRCISSVNSREELVSELAERSWGYCKDLGEDTVRMMKNMSVTSLVMTVRAVEDPFNQIYNPIYEYNGVSNKAASEITEAVKDAGFMFIESRDSYFVRIFLTKLLSETIDSEIAENYGTVAEYEARQQFSEKKINKFSRILNGLLTSQEYQVLCLRLGLLTKRIHSIKECAKILSCSEEEAKCYYDLAMAKLWGNKKSLKAFGYSWGERRRCLSEARVARKRLARLYYNGGYLLNPESA